MRTTRMSLVVAVILALLNGAAVVAGEAEGSVGADAAATEANEAAYVDAFFSKDLDALMAAFTGDPVFEDQTFGDYRVGALALRGMEGAVLRLTDPELTTLLDRFVSVDGSRAVLVLRWAGTNYLGRPFDMPVLVLHEYQDGKIAKESIYYAASDAYDQLTQQPAADG